MNMTTALKAAVIEAFAPRFAPRAHVLSLDVTMDKVAQPDTQLVHNGYLALTAHGKPPDVALYDHGRDWLFLIDTVTSNGPVTPERIFELEKMLETCSAGRVFVSAFSNFAKYADHIEDIARETHVWIPDAPDHMIHHDGSRFMGPRP